MSTFVIRRCMSLAILAGLVAGCGAAPTAAGEGASTAGVAPAPQRPEAERRVSQAVRTPGWAWVICNRRCGIRDHFPSSEEAGRCRFFCIRAFLFRRNRPVITHL
jgi:hypothetical protein